MSFNDLPPPFPPRPIPVGDDDNPYRVPFRKAGLHTLSSIMLLDFDNGIFSLAKSIEDTDRCQSRFQSSVIRSSPRPIPRILDILLSMSPTTIRAAITGKLHTLLSNPSEEARLPQHFPIQPHEPGAHQERPVIYVLIHCSPTHRTPTKREYLKVLDDMDTYIKTYDRDVHWTAADKLAHVIDRVSPDIEGRNWRAGVEGKALETWTKFQDGTPIRHPRRYCSTDSARQKIVEFIATMNMRLSKLENDNEPIPWSVTYTGWSRQELAREQQHFKHLSGQAIPQ